MVSEWNQWLVPAPSAITDRPLVRSAPRANSRPMRAACSAGTEVIVSCHAGVYGSHVSSYEAGHAVLRQKQVEDRGDEPAADPAHRQPAHHDRAAFRAALAEAGQRDLGRLLGPLQKAQFGYDVAQVQVPAASPGFPHRKPSEPPGTTGSPVALSRRTVWTRRAQCRPEVGGGQEPVRDQPAVVLARGA